MKNMNLKVAAASVGAGALIAMGGITMATSSAEPTEPSPGPIPVEEATLGNSSTEETAATTPSTPSAEPSIKGPAPLPSEEEGLPG